MADILVHCVVCGAGSHREDWQPSVTKTPACDKHSKIEIAKALSTVSKPGGEDAVNENRPPAVSKPLTPVTPKKA